MRNNMLAAAMLAASSILIAAPVAAQDLPSLSGPDYVRLAADGDNFEIQSGRLASTKAQREDVRGFARQVVADHVETGKALAAALTNQDRKITPPSTRLSADKQAKLDLLRKAPKGSFDRLYLQQQAEAHQAMLALDQAYAANGTDPALKQVAAAAVPVVNRHASTLAGLSGAM